MERIISTAAPLIFPAWRRHAALLKSFAASAHRGSAPLFWTSVAAGALFLVTLGLQVVDPRMVGGVSTWLKPAKFGASILLTGPVLAWIFDQIQPSTRWLRRVGVLFSLMSVIELVLITIQAARAVPSHFNFTTTGNAVLFQAMGIAITLFWLGQIWLTIRVFRHRFSNETLGWGIRMSLLVATLGSGLGFTMTARPTPAQVENLEAGRPTLVGVHAVGVPDGGPGLPLTRWSSTGGDLRVAHFLGLHALHLIPLASWLVIRRRKPSATTSRLIIGVGLAYAGLVATTLVQALRGIPLLSPDGLTLIMAGAAFAIGAVGARAPSPATWPAKRRSAATSLH